jgi:hypothetical protein
MKLLNIYIIILQNGFDLSLLINTVGTSRRNYFVFLLISYKRPETWYRVKLVTAILRY